MYRQVWIGGQDLAMMLRSVGGWHVGCIEERDHIIAVQHAIENGWLAKRIHFAPAFPEGVEAWELTDSGLEYLGDISGPQMKGGADKMRNWYRSHKKTWLSAHGHIKS